MRASWFVMLVSMVGLVVAVFVAVVSPPISASRRTFYRSPALTQHKRNIQGGG
jgi:hypothetical protein